MKDLDRPAIVFLRTVNAGITPRKEKRDKDGNIKKPAHPGEFQEKWVKPLVDRKPPFAPYSLCKGEWVQEQINRGRKVIGVLNMEKLPADYPREWRDKIEDAIAIAQPFANAYAREVEITKQLQEAEDKLKASEAANEQRQQPTELRQQSEEDRPASGLVQRASRKAGQAAHV